MTNRFLEMSGTEKYEALKERRETRRRRLTVLTVQPGCCYYDLDAAPIGGKFRRAPETGLRVTDLTPITIWHGCDYTGRTTKTGVRVAFNSEYCLEFCHEK